MDASAGAGEPSRVSGRVPPSPAGTPDPAADAARLALSAGGSSGRTVGAGTASMVNGPVTRMRLVSSRGWSYRVSWPGARCWNGLQGDVRDRLVLETAANAFVGMGEL